MPNGEIFTQQFLITIEGLVRMHHSIYREIPPQGIYFEALVEEAFRRARIPFIPIEPTSRNVPKHDIMVGGVRLSIKTETGYGTNPDYIYITKLCTTEKDPWEAKALIAHVMHHLTGYDCILMLRSVWDRPVIHYQLLDIPMDLLRLVETAKLVEVGKARSRRSLGADIFQGEKKIFHVHFDGSDGKCQIRKLPVSECQLLATWDVQI